MAALSVNVNKLATLRNSRGKNLPDVTALARKILTYGAHGITVHPRPDGRHIRTADVEALQALVLDWKKQNAKVEFNIEGYPSEEFLQLVNRHCPEQVTLVPDPPEALTSNAGWDLIVQETLLKKTLQHWRQGNGPRVSLFIDPFQFSEAQGAALLRLKPDRIELYTERYADAFATPERDQVTQVYARAARFAAQNGIGVNAGHDLNQKNLKHLLSHAPQIQEVSIGHALICEALEEGLETTIKNYLRLVHP